MATFIRGAVERIRTSTGDTGRMRGGSTAVAGVVGGSLAVLLLATSGGLWATASSTAADVDRVSVFTGLPDRPLRMVNGSVDVLLVATERRRLSYAILAHVSRRHETTVLVDLPAGSLVDVPAHTDPEGKRVPAARRPLATAYADGGPRLLAQSLEAATQLRLDGYAELDLAGVARLVDDLGGMDVCVPAAVTDKAAKLRLPPGAHRLTGAQAVAFLRTTSGGPLERVRHNQLLFGAVTGRLFGASAPFRSSANRRLLASGARALRVDDGFDLTLARRLTLALRDPYGDHVAIVSVPAAKTTKTATGTTTTWQSRLAEYLFEKLRTDAELDPALVTPAPVTVAPGSVRVRVRNGTGVEGLGGDAADDLKDVGFTLRGKPDNATTRTGVTTVYHHAKYARQANTVQAALPGSRLAKLKKETATILVVIGGNYAGARQVTYVEGTTLGDTKPGESITTPGPCADA